MGIKVSICGKGGSGKSTLVSILAIAAQGRGLKTLVIDSDGLNKDLWAVLNKISSESLISEIKKELKKREMESNDEGYLLTGLLGNQKLVKGVIRKIEIVQTLAQNHNLRPVLSIK